MSRIYLPSMEMISQHLDDDPQLEEPKDAFLLAWPDASSSAKPTPSLPTGARAPKAARDRENAEHAIESPLPKRNMPVESHGACEKHWQQLTLQVERLQADLNLLEGNFLCLQQQLSGVLERMDELAAESQANPICTPWVPDPVGSLHPTEFHLTPLQSSPSDSGSSADVESTLAPEMSAHCRQQDADNSLN